MDNTNTLATGAIVTQGTRAVSRCDLLGVAPYSEATDALSRPYLSPAHDKALQRLEQWMRAASMSVRRDAMGNLIGRYAGHTADAPALLIGSHIDSVHDGGRYDGPLGIMIGIEVVAALAARREHLPFAIEVIAFGDEEGSRFPSSMLCSRALVGALPEDALTSLDHQGVSLAQALQAFGLDPGAVAQARRHPAEIIGYLEAHIEQGPVLEAEQLPVGIVTGIAGQLRLKARFAGLAGHAGTSPMHLRRDALAGAAAGILAVERICAGRSDELVGTVGHVQCSTAAFNVIVGTAELLIDIRSGSNAARDAAAAEIRAELQQIAAGRGLQLAISVVQDLPAVPCDAALRSALHAAVATAGVRPFQLVSGAGHDAMVLAQLAPMAMLFIRCAGGISHNPRESVAAPDVDTAITVLVEFLRRLGAAKLT